MKSGLRIDYDFVLIFFTLIYLTAISQLLYML